MKKLTLFLIPVIAAGLLQACSANKSSSTTDSTSVKTDTTKMTTVSKPDSTSSAMSDTAFANKAAIGGMAEVALGKMAASKGISKDVKDFGSMMVMDHGKANNELKGIAQNKILHCQLALTRNTKRKAT